MQNDVSSVQTVYKIKSVLSSIIILFRYPNHPMKIIHVLLDIVNSVLVLFMILS